MTSAIDPLLTPLLTSDATDVLVVSAPPAAPAVWIDRGQGLERVSEKVSGPLNAESLHLWFLSKLSEAGLSWDAKNPFVDLMLPSGWRLHAALPPATAGPVLSLRRSRRPPGTAELRWGPPWQVLLAALGRGESLLISGATGSGKTTLLGDLIDQLGGTLRVLLLEDIPEIQTQHPHVVSLVARPPNADGLGEITLRTLLRQALRMRPDRLVMGECRGAEVLDLLQALNTGHRGALGTLHANSVRDACRRLELLCLMSAPAGLTPIAVRQLLASSLRLVAQVEKRGHLRHITEIGQVEGLEGEQLLIRPLVASEPHREAL